jgi:hypothetical protein
VAGRHCAPVGEKLAVVVEDDDPVAEKAPALFGWTARTWAAHRSAEVAAGQVGWWLHMAASSGKRAVACPGLERRVQAWWPGVGDGRVRERLAASGATGELDAPADECGLAGGLTVHRDLRESTGSIPDSSNGAPDRVGKHRTADRL